MQPEQSWLKDNKWCYLNISFKHGLEPLFPFFFHKEGLISALPTSQAAVMTAGNKEVTVC